MTSPGIQKSLPIIADSCRAFFEHAQHWQTQHTHKEAPTPSVARPRAALASAHQPPFSGARRNRDFEGERSLSAWAFSRRITSKEEGGTSGEAYLKIKKARRKKSSYIKPGRRGSSLATEMKSWIENSITVLAACIVLYQYTRLYAAAVHQALLPNSGLQTL